MQWDVNDLNTKNKRRTAWWCLALAQNSSTSYIFKEIQQIEIVHQAWSLSLDVLSSVAAFVPHSTALCLGGVFFLLCSNNKEFTKGKCASILKGSGCWRLKEMLDWKALLTRGKIKETILRIRGQPCFFLSPPSCLEPYTGTLERQRTPAHF